jgi:hypothetical protein
LRSDQPSGDITSDILSRWSKQSESLPSIAELPGFLDGPLSEDEKMPLSGEDFEQLLSSLPHDICTRGDAAILFRVSESEKSPSLRTLFSSAIMNLTPLDSGSEDSFHALWDDHIQRILSVLLPTGISIRDSSLHTSTQKLRPDFGFLLDNVCLFRGEEKSTSNRDDPKAELCDKLTWVYSPAPYVFGEPITGL